MARITVEDCLKNVKNRFELVLVAAKRARDIARKGIEPLVSWEDDKASVVALREIAAGLIDASILTETPDQQENRQREENFKQENLVAESVLSTEGQQMEPPRISLSSIGVVNTGSSILPEVLLKQEIGQTVISSTVENFQPVLLKDFSVEPQKNETEIHSKEVLSEDNKEVLSEDNSKLYEDSIGPTPEEGVFPSSTDNLENGS